VVGPTDLGRRGHVAKARRDVEDERPVLDEGEVERLLEKPAQQIRARSLHAEDDIDRLTRSPIPEGRKRVRHIPQRYTRM
jgi:hypothetical protein